MYMFLRPGLSLDLNLTQPLTHVLIYLEIFLHAILMCQRAPPNTTNFSCQGSINSHRVITLSMPGIKGFFINYIHSVLEPYFPLAIVSIRASFLPHRALSTKCSSWSSSTCSNKQEQNIICHHTPHNVSVEHNGFVTY